MAKVQRRPVNLEGSGAIGWPHRIYTSPSLGELLNRKPGRLHPGFQRPAYYGPLEARIRANVDKAKKPNDATGIPRVMRRPTRR